MFNCIQYVLVIDQAIYITTRQQFLFEYKGMYVGQQYRAIYSTFILYPQHFVFVSRIIPVVTSCWQDHEGETRDHL